MKHLFEQELTDEPPPANDVVRDAMQQGVRLRRRRGLTGAGAAAAGVLAVAATVLGLGLPARLGPAPGASPVGPGAAAAPAPGGTADQRCWRRVYTDEAPAARRDPAQVSIFLTGNITGAERAALERTVRADPLVDTWYFETRARAYANFAQLWRDSPELVKQVSSGQLPEAFRVTLKDPASYGTFDARIRARPGVDDVVNQPIIPLSTPQPDPVRCPGAKPGEGR